MREIRALIKVKTLITLPLVYVMCYGFIIGKITPAEFMLIMGLVIGFYFKKNEAPSKEDTE